MIKEILEEISINLFESKLIANGTCFEDSYNYIMKNKNVILVHGLVVGKGPIEGILFNHAWIEDGNTVIDVAAKNKGAKKYKFPKDFYYAYGNIDEKTVFRYNYKEMLAKLIEFETYGPWEDVLLNNKY